MKELLGQLGLSEIFMHICPGAVLLCSIVIWTDGTSRTELRTFKDEEIVGALVFLVLAYTVGVILASAANRLAGRCYMLRGRAKLPGKGRESSRVLLIALTILGWFPEPLTRKPLFKRQVSEYNLRIGEELFQAVRIEGLSSLEIPWDKLAIYRVVMGNLAGEKAQQILTEAEIMRRRFLFSLNVSLSLAIVAVECFCAVVWKLAQFGHAQSLPAIALLVLGCLFGATSAGLRVVAGRWWELERILTYSWIEMSDKARASAASHNLGDERTGG